MKIRTEQLAVLSEMMKHQFEKRMVEYLKSLFPAAQSLSPDRLLDTVRNGVQAAAAYGVLTEYDLQRYLECLFKYSPMFDKDPQTQWAAAILTDPELEADEKMDLIESHTD